MIETNHFTLDNGLKVVHNYDSSTAMVAVDVLYNVGARDESDDLTGMAHLFEHLMFGGSINIPNYDAELEQAGGYSNAWTSDDFTNFYDVVPAQNIETALHLESDRMLSLAFNDKALEVQRGVVIEEFKEVCLNRPYGDMSHYLRAMMYREHPYRYPVIGKEIAHIEKVTQDNVRDFFFKHYAPNNAVIAISGNVTLERTKQLIDKWFGDIPARDITPRHIPEEEYPCQSRRSVVYGDVPQTTLTIAFRMPRYSSPDYIICDLITDLLAAGRSSRIYQHLINDGTLFTEADASITGNEESGLIILSGRITNESNECLANAEKALLDEAIRLATPGEISQYELERTLNRFESNQTFNNMGYLAKAQALATAEIHNQDINLIVEQYRKITLDDIARVAREIFINHPPCTLVYRPNELAK
jgi:predicted Zn-dependent peptidase